MKKQICCRCLTKSKTGYGNFKRCLTLAKELKKNQISTFFIIDKNQKISNELRKNHFHYSTIPMSSYAREHIFIKKFMKKNQISTVLLDVRQYGQSLSKKLKTETNKIILIDDLWSDKIYSDVFINSTNVKSHDDYEIINDNSIILLGTKYWIIDKNYKIYKKTSYKIPDKTRLKLVISLGGSDPENITSHLLKQLVNRNDMEIKIIIGPMNNNFSKLKNLTKNLDSITLVKSPKNIFEIFSQADLVISNGGNTLFELITLRIPTIAIPAFTHEEKYVKNFSNDECIIKFNKKQKNINKIINDFKSSRSLQKNLFTATKNIIDGKGLKRCSDIISTCMK